MSKSERDRQEFLTRGRELILANADTMGHALTCEPCGLRFQAELSLALVGWSAGDFWQEVVDDALGDR